MGARRRLWALAALVAAGAWAGLLSGAPAFSTTAEAELTPALVVLLAAALVPGARDRARPAGARRVAPALWLIGAAVVLELVGLGLGGRSPVVPTLSDALDALTATRAARAAAALVWLVTGLAFAVRKGPVRGERG